MRLSNYLQMDNGASFIGDLIHPRHFSRVKNAEEAGLIKIHEYRISENIKRFEEKF